jgi:hypothetical protein
MEAQQKYPKAEKWIITAIVPKKLPSIAHIKVMPLWKFLLKKISIS